MSSKFPNGDTRGRATNDVNASSRDQVNCRPRSTNQASVTSTRGLTPHHKRWHTAATASRSILFLPVVSRRGRVERLPVVHESVVSLSKYSYGYVDKGAELVEPPLFMAFAAGGFSARECDCFCERGEFLSSATTRFAKISSSRESADLLLDSALVTLISLVIKPPSLLSTQ